MLTIKIFKMKKFINIKLLLLTIILVLNSCSKDDDPKLIPIESSQMKNLHAPQLSDYSTNPPTVSGDFVKFDFSSGNITSDEKEWDIAFRGTTIALNGGSDTGTAGEPSRNGNAAAYIEEDLFSNVNKVDESSFTQDGANGFSIPTGSGNGWYNYNPMNRQISPIAGKIIVIRTADNFYAKMEILSYYKDLDPSNPANGRYYTFNYVYQPNEGVKSFD